MNNISTMEVSSIRDQLLLSLDKFHKARPLAAESVKAAAKRKALDTQQGAEPAKRTLKRFK